MKSFTQTTSLVRRFRAVGLLIALFVLLDLAGVFIFNRESLRGMREVRQVNSLLGLTSRIGSSVESATDSLRRVAEGAARDEVELLYRLSQEQTSGQLEQMIELSRNQEGMSELIRGVTETWAEFRENADQVLAEQDNLKIPNELLILEQLESELLESLQRIQIHLQVLSDTRFNEIYERRYRPLLSMAALATLLFVVIFLLVNRTTLRLQESISALLAAVDRVSDGDLSTRAPLKHADEIGRLTWAFNKMTESLQQGTENLHESRNRAEQNAARVGRLQRLTAALSGSLGVAQVSETLLEQGLDFVRADAGMIAQISDDGTLITITAQRGYPPEIAQEGATFSISTPIPISEAIRDNVAIWLESREQMLQRYPAIGDYPYFHSAMTVLPLSGGDQILGCLLLTFQAPTRFSQEDRDFLIAVARQCGQALHRALLYDRAQRAVRLRDEFLSIASHELRTPLTPLKLQVQMLARMLTQGKLESISPERLSMILDTANGQIQRLTRLVEELLDVSRISSGRLTLEPESFDLSGLVQEVVDRFTHEAANVGCEIHVDGPDELLGVWDRFRIEQVITNLLSNALRYGRGKPIDIRVRGKGERVRLEFQDRGMGISPADQARIFRRFERAVSSNAFGGLGLGLYITKQIVDQHRGQIEVISAPGQGATFVVELPRQADTPGLSDEASAPSPSERFDGPSRTHSA